MSEEEIKKEQEEYAIKLLTNMIAHNPDNIRLNWREGIPALKLILDLYNKEKEKNKELSNTNKKLYDLAHRQAMQQFIENDYINKAKIQQKIKEWKKEKYIAGEHLVVQVLQELLEEK